MSPQRQRVPHRLGGKSLQQAREGAPRQGKKGGVRQGKDTGEPSLSFEKCDDFIENDTDKEVTKTITICSDEDNAVAIDIGGHEVTRVLGHKCKTVIVTIPANSALHAGGKGRWRLEP